MQPALYIITTVLPDNRIEIDLPPGTAGQQVTVFVVLTDSSAATNNTSTLEKTAALAQMAAEPAIQAELAALNPISTSTAESRAAVSDILKRISSRPRVNPLEFGLPDSTDLIREDRER